jgi:outer membrane receptor protein involved in Fe transport
LARVDPLPAVTLVYKPTTRVNVRTAFSQTVARPQLRELAPFAFADFFGAREVQGNPALDRTRITNADLRFEYFPGATEVVALSVFYKDFQKPIERTIIATNQGVVTFQNALGAVTGGLELEGRKGAGFIAPWLRELTFVGNLTLMSSRARIDPSTGGVQTNNVRPMQNQSPYVLNLALDYQREVSKTRVRLSYNTYGRRIAEVGAQGLPDVYEQPRHIVDLTAMQGIGNHWDVKASIENIGNAPFVFTQGPETRDDIIVNRYVAGANFFLQLTYQN